MAYGIFKKEDPHERRNYRIITVQVTVIKLFEQLLTKQLSYGFNNKLCDKLTAYKKISTLRQLSWL